MISMKVLEEELKNLIGEDNLKNIGEQIAEIVRQHGLHKSPDICSKLFSYLPSMFEGWNGQGQVDSVGLQVGEYSQIIIFRNEKLFLDVLGANPHMKAIHGTEDHDKQLFPGLYAAAMKNNENEGGNHA